MVGLIRISLVLYILVVYSLVTASTVKSTKSTNKEKAKGQFVKDLPKPEREKYADLLKKAVEDNREAVMSISYQERENGTEALLKTKEKGETIMGFFSKYFVCYLHFHVGKDGTVHTIRGFAKTLCVPKFDKFLKAGTVALYHELIGAYKHVMPP